MYVYGLGENRRRRIGLLNVDFWRQEEAKRILGERREAHRRWRGHIFTEGIDYGNVWKRLNTWELHKGPFIIIST